MYNLSRDSMLYYSMTHIVYKMMQFLHVKSSAPAITPCVTAQFEQQASNKQASAHGSHKCKKKI